MFLRSSPVSGDLAAARSRALISGRGKPAGFGHKLTICFVLDSLLLHHHTSMAKATAVLTEFIYRSSSGINVTDDRNFLNEGAWRCRDRMLQKTNASLYTLQLKTWVAFCHLCNMQLSQFISMKIYKTSVTPSSQTSTKKEHKSSHVHLNITSSLQGFVNMYFEMFWGSFPLLKFQTSQLWN